MLMIFIVMPQFARFVGKGSLLAHQYDRQFSVTLVVQSDTYLALSVDLVVSAPTSTYNWVRCMLRNGGLARETRHGLCHIDYSSTMMCQYWDKRLIY